MASTNQTSVLHLPLFVGTDKPSWLGDWNSAMSAIDSAIGTAQGDISSVSGVANSAKSTADAVKSQVTALEGTVSTLQGEVTDNMGDISSLEADVSNIQSQLTLLAGAVKIETVPFFTRGNMGTGNEIASTALTFYQMLSGGQRVGLRIDASKGFFNSQPMVPVVLDDDGLATWFQIGYLKGNPLNVPVQNWGNQYKSALFGVTVISGTDASGGFAPLEKSIFQNGVLLVYTTELNATAVIVMNRPTAPSAQHHPIYFSGTPGFVPIQNTGSLSSANNFQPLFGPNT